MGGVLLDPITGQPREVGADILGPDGRPISLVKNVRAGWRESEENTGRWAWLPPSVKKLPDHIQAWLDKARDERERFGIDELGRPYMAAGQFWEMLETNIVADATQVLNTTTETIMVPDFTIPGGWLYPGRALKYTIIGTISTVITTPGTITAALRWGGVAGTALATSGAFAPDPTAASTTVTHMFEYWLTCRAVGASGSIMAHGRAEWSDYDDNTTSAPANLVANLNMRPIPASAPAAVTVNTVAANALSPTIKFSVATATTQFTAQQAFLESLN